MKRFFLFFILSGAILLSGCRSDRLYFIYETDIGNDIDDALALDMLYKYKEQGVWTCVP